MYVVNARLTQDLVVARLLVVIKRYDQPVESYGLHLLADVDNSKLQWLRPRGSSYQHHTMGLYDKEAADEIIRVATEVLHYPECDWRSDQLLVDTIGQSLIPIEWKAEYREAAPAVMDRIRVYGVPQPVEVAV